MNSTKQCRYCQGSIVNEGREHVFPKGMGGQNIYMENVCTNCNKKFSKYERALMRDSPIAFMRSVEGVEGYRKSGRSSGAFAAPILFSFDEKEKVVYEIGQRYPLQNFVRPQIIQINGVFYLEGENADEVQNLLKKFNHWKREVLLIVVKNWTDPPTIQWIEFVDTGAKAVYITRDNAASKKEAIKIDLLSSNYRLFTHLSPRLLVNDLGELRIRARSLDEALNFLSELMSCTREHAWMNSYNKDGFNHPIIYVGQSFDGVLFSQGLVKVGLNCLMYYYPAIKDSAQLNDCITFVMTSKGNVSITLEPKNSIKDSVEDTHNLFFQQTSHGMNVRVSFFNGAGGAFSFYVFGLMAMAPGEFNRLVVDYKNHTTEFQDRTKFLLSFDRE